MPPMPPWQRNRKLSDKSSLATDATFSRWHRTGDFPPGWSSFWFRGSRRAIEKFLLKNATPASCRGEVTLNPSVSPGSKKQPHPGFQVGDAFPQETALKLKDAEA